MSSLLAIFATKNVTGYGLNVIISVICLLYLKRDKGKPMIFFISSTTKAVTYDEHPKMKRDA